MHRPVQRNYATEMTHVSRGEQGESLPYSLIFNALYIKDALTSLHWLSLEFPPIYRRNKPSSNIYIP